MLFGVPAFIGCSKHAAFEDLKSQVWSIWLQGEESAYFWEGSFDKVSHTSHPFLCYEFLPTTCEVMQGSHSNDSCLLVGAEAFRTEDALAMGQLMCFYMQWWTRFQGAAIF